MCVCAPRPRVAGPEQEADQDGAPPASSPVLRKVGCAVFEDWPDRPAMSSQLSQGCLCMMHSTGLCAQLFPMADAIPCTAFFMYQLF